MKYTLICFTFNKKESKEGIEMGMSLRTNWIDYVNNEERLSEYLISNGIKTKPTFSKSGDVVKLSGDFTLPNTRIIVHIVKN